MPDTPGAVEFRRELGLLDAAVVVAGAIVGVGIFANPSNVARIVGEPVLIVAAWIAGGVLALLGGFAYAELASRLPVVGGQYVYLARA
ncbi:MAG TPA: amino acid permease, partial [Candidatus Polarisedimenticolia bacterium]|nr:amino acid permease [Candidatus Polarisedimenticolia bacterium]